MEITTNLLTLCSVAGCLIYSFLVGKADIYSFVWLRVGSLSLLIVLLLQLQDLHQVSPPPGGHLPLEVTSGLRVCEDKHQQHHIKLYGYGRCSNLSRIQHLDKCIDNKIKSKNQIKFGEWNQV